jgi:hypothetical protein
MVRNEFCVDERDIHLCSRDSSDPPPLAGLHDEAQSGEIRLIVTEGVRHPRRDCTGELWSRRQPLTRLSGQLKLVPRHLGCFATRSTSQRSTIQITEPGHQAEKVLAMTT